MTTKKEKQIKKQEKELERKLKRQEKDKRSKERLEAFKSIGNIGEAGAFVLVYGKNVVLLLVMFILGYVFRHYELFSAIFKKFGLISEVTKVIK